MRNTLYYGDNLNVLREYIPDESVDLVYFDPPFNSNASYNVLFREKTGEESPTQIKAFTDTWEWRQETERTFEQDIILDPDTPSAVKEMISAFRQFIGTNAMMAYLVLSCRVARSVVCFVHVYSSAYQPYRCRAGATGEMGERPYQPVPGG